MHTVDKSGRERPGGNANVYRGSEDGSLAKGTYFMHKQCKHSGLQSWIDVGKV